MSDGIHVADLVKENKDLKEALAVQIKKCLSLEEECDLLAEHNQRLQDELNSYKKSNPSSAGTIIKKYVYDKEIGQINNELSGGREFVPYDCALTIDQACGKTNVLCAAFVPAHKMVVCGGVDKGLRVYYVGSGDSSILICTYYFSAPVLSVDTFKGVVACSMMDGTHAVIWSLPQYKSSNDSEYPLSVHVTTNDTYEDVSNRDNSLGVYHPLYKNGVQLFSDHTKYVVSVRFCPIGKHLATASYDKSVNLYVRKLVDTSSLDISIASHGSGNDISNASNASFYYMNHLRVFQFTSAPEALVFTLLPTPPDVTDVSDDASNKLDATIELVVALSDTCYLAYITCDYVNKGSVLSRRGECTVFKTSQHSTEEVDTEAGVEAEGDHINAAIWSYTPRRVSLNENEWDSHVSFSALFLSVSPSYEYIAVSTNHSLHYCYAAGTNTRIKTFVGMSNEYSKPRTCWSLNHPHAGDKGNNSAVSDSCSFFFATADDSHDVMVYSLCGNDSGAALGTITTSFNKSSYTNSGAVTSRSSSSSSSPSNHTGIIKDLRVHPLTGHILTASFDKSIRLWRMIGSGEDRDGQNPLQSVDCEKPSVDMEAGLHGLFYSADAYDAIVTAILNAYEEKCSKGSAAQSCQLWVGLAGCPGSGKTTLSALLAEKLQQKQLSVRRNVGMPPRQCRCVVIPMDGYHYYRSELETFPDVKEAFDRRGAPFTFNGVKCVRDLYTAKEQGFGSFPSFDHGLGDPIESDIHLDPEVDIVIVEGNYLLLSGDPWSKLNGMSPDDAIALGISIGGVDHKKLFDVSFYVKYDDENEIISRLCTRHMKAWQGTTKEEALQRVMNSDIINARLIDAAGNGKENADYYVDCMSGLLTKLL